MSSSEITNGESQQFLITANYYIIGIGGFFIFIIGILTNILNLIILNRKSMKSTTNRYLTALAISDLFVLILSKLTLSNSYIKDYKDTPYLNKEFNSLTNFNEETFDGNFTLHASNDTIDLVNLEEFNHDSIKHSLFTELYNTWATKIYPHMFPYIFPFAIMFQISTVWINLGMTVDRFIAINFPLKSLKFCTISKANKIISLIFFSSFLYSFPRFFEYRVVSNKYELNIDVNETESLEVVYFTFTELGQSRLFRRIVYFWMYIFLQSVAPLIILSVLNFALIVSLKKSNQMLKGFNDLDFNARWKIIYKKTRQLKEQNQKNITIMLITVIVSFIILQTPAAICNFVHGYISLFSSLDTLCYIGNFFILTCSSINFFSYCIFNKRFRKELTRLAFHNSCLIPISKRGLFISQRNNFEDFSIVTSEKIKSSKLTKKNNLVHGISNKCENVIVKKKISIKSGKKLENVVTSKSSDDFILIKLNNNFKMNKIVML